ncbi:P27 family phage terminase small subunit [Kitasatospora sp. NPDC098663]|uniref:P27 family phage terminase small subunit n=1 Tax=Kitasatospora sp. NPDC098663 TaxID=3364096 RepID=UPI0037FED036
MVDRYRPKPAAIRAREGNPFNDSPAAEIQAANIRCREITSAEWQRVVSILEVAAGLGEVDHSNVKDLCVCVARIDQAERDLSERGLMVTAERGTVKNGAAAIATQYRSQLARYIRELGLSPSARAAIAPPGPGDDSDIWD